MQQKVPASDADRAYKAGLRILASRARTRVELRQRLAMRFPTDAVQQAVASLEEHGYLNDAAFARRWRESRDEHMPRSAALIRRELQQKGVARDLADAAVEGLDDEDSAYRAALRHMRTLHGVDYATFTRRMRDYLRRRGFSLSVVRRTVERLWEERGRE